LALTQLATESRTMTTINASNPLANMLNNTFDKLDQDQSASLDRGEFKSLYEVLKPGIAADKDGKLLIGEDEEFLRMDHNADGQVSRTEMQSTGVLMPAKLTDDSLGSMIEYLKLLDTFSAKSAVALLSAPDLPVASAHNDSIK
jgi:Ca2+-binding EF-hand superfamily protein